MKLTITTPFTQKTIDIAWLELETPAGNFVILHGHAPTILTLTPKKRVTYGLTSGKQESFVVHRGIAEIRREAATLIIDSMEALSS